MTDIATDLATLLCGIDRAGDFHAHGTAEIFAPGLEAGGVGPIALPLLPAQAEQLIAIATQAPYGRGERTVVDTGVRRTWQINADQVQIRGRAWARTLDDIVARVAEGLGVAEPITADLYKLLVYDEGGFFLTHRDTEKTSGMFADWKRDDRLTCSWPHCRELGGFLADPSEKEWAFRAVRADRSHVESIIRARQREADRKTLARIEAL